MSEKPTESRVREAVSKLAGKAALSLPVKRLAGHASMRSYWRLGPAPDSENRGAAGPCWVVMVMPSDAKPEEVTKGGIPTELPFVNVQRYLKGIGVRVPEILDWDEAEGLMVLEDLGDDMLETRLLAGDSREELYGRAIDALARMRAAAEKKPDPRCIAFTRRFDRDLYHWELMHFVEWGLEAWKERKLSPAEGPVVLRHFETISRALEAEEMGLTHRDYQSRNIMILPGGAQVVIDFQDALLGPRQYDLVALLRDSYVVLDQPFIDKMLRRYLETFAQAGGPRLDFEPFRKLFDLLTVQRKLKDAGRFVFIDRVRKNPNFLVSIPASLQYLREAFDRRPDLAELREILAGHVPELR
jgi:aminoglycoside/choline kinase family phosphotransferase